MNTLRTFSLTSSSILALLWSVAAHAQGPLSPPPGAPAPTMKSLDQVEPRTPISSLPFVITAPGSYYVTRDLSVADGYEGDGISIGANNVTIDLGGFTLDGRGTGRHGLAIHTTRYGLQVRNGNVENWTGRGVDLESCPSARLDDVQVRNNAVGIFVSHGTLTHCVASSNAQTGIRANFSNLQECSATGNPIGIDLYSSTLRASRAGTSSDSGIVASRSLVEGCQLDQNRWGIVVSGGSNIRGNTVYESDSDGIRVVGTGSSLISENNVVSNGVGVPASGIWIQSSGNRILNNNVTGNRSAGIGVAGSFNTIDGNSVLQNTGVGIEAGGSKNTVVRNSSLGNGPPGGPVTNYSIAAGNNPGPVIAASSSTNTWSNTQ